jgi:chloramphenicol 3-O-phosphotransferase
MARRSPRAVREQSYPPLAQPVEGLSARADAEVGRLQGRRPDIEVRRALVGYRRSVNQSRRRIRFDEDSGLDDDVLAQRDMLDDAMRLLPEPARAELRRLIAPLDEAFLRRTLPDPLAPYVPWRGAAWWHQRITLR